MKILIPLLLIIQFVSFFSLSQYEWEKRFEMALNKNEIPLDPVMTSDGVIYQSYTIGEKDAPVIFKFIKYDMDLKMEKTVEIKIPPFYSRTTYTAEDLHYIACVDKSNEYVIYSLNIETLQFETIKKGRFAASVPSQMYIEKLVIKDDMAYACSYYITGIRDRHEGIVCIDLKNNYQRNIPVDAKEFGLKTAHLEKFELSSQSDELVVLIKANREERGVDFFMQRYDKRGENKISSICLTKDFDADLTDISIKPLGNSHYIFTGAYFEMRCVFCDLSTRDYERYDQRLTDGFFICKTNADEIEFFKSYHYLDLKNFLNFQSVREKGKMQKQNDKNQEKGKESEYQTGIIYHDLILYKDQFILIGEAYDAIYSTSVSGSTISSTSTESSRSFEGYDYTHSTLISFDQDGDLNWDMSFKMLSRYPLPKKPVEFITVFPSEEEEIKLYSFNTYDMQLTTINLQEERLLTDPLFRLQADNRPSINYKIVWSSRNNNTSFWSENVILQHGRIQIKGGDTRKKRMIFFMTKFLANLN